MPSAGGAERLLTRLGGRFSSVAVVGCRGSPTGTSESTADGGLPLLWGEGDRCRDRRVVLPLFALPVRDSFDDANGVRRRSGEAVEDSPLVNTRRGARGAGHDGYRWPSRSVRSH